MNEIDLYLSLFSCFLPLIDLLLITFRTIIRRLHNKELVTIVFLFLVGYDNHLLTTLLLDDPCNCGVLSLVSVVAAITFHLVCLA